MSLSGSWTTDAVTLVAILLATAFYYYAIAYSFWKKKNVPQMRPTIPFVETYKLFSGKLSFNELMDDGYQMFKDKGFGGFYSFGQPVLLVCDPNLIQQMLIKDFASFHDHSFSVDPENDPLNANLFNVTGKRWNRLRSKLSPTFTSGKIKAMFPLVHECVQQLQDCVREESSRQNGSVEMLNLLMRFCADVIGTCAFGINCHCLKNPDAEFQHMGREMLTTSFRNFIQFFIQSTCPKMSKYVTARQIFPKTSAFFTDLMSSTVKYRRENKVERKDFVQLMMQISDEDDKFFNQDIMTAQAMIFFIAGLDNIANQVGFCLHEMALNPVLQENVYNEIIRVMAEFDGEINYEAVKKMDLVSRVLDEGLRKYTPSGFLMREQTADSYQIPGTDVVLKRGTSVLIPMQSIHLDGKYFPEPQKFDPGRFTEEVKSQRHPFAYLPFGEGPRFCIASRFAKLELRLCFAELVRRFKFEVDPKTDLSLTLNKSSFSPTPIKGFWLKVTERVA